MRRASWFNVTSVVTRPDAFLYLPIAILVIYSFNASRLVTVWGGWSTRWYVELFHDRGDARGRLGDLANRGHVRDAATVLGTLTAVALVRYGRFRGRMLFSGMVYAPLVMPEVITGLSLLMLFVALNVDRGFWTIALAHTTLTMCFVTVVVQSRLLSFDTSLEEAAIDLGCPPWKTFLVVTLPMIAPAIASGWMLAFTLSLDDLVIASFTTGPGRDHAADPHLFGDPPRRETGDQCDLHDPDRGRRHRPRGGIAVQQALRHGDPAADGSCAAACGPVRKSARDQRAGSDVSPAFGSGAGWVSVAAGAYSDGSAGFAAVSGAEGGVGCGGAAGKLTPNFSIAERIASRAVLLRSASSSGCAAPERSDQALRVRQHDGIVPCALHHERQFERRRRRGRHQARGARAGRGRGRESRPSRPARAARSAPRRGCPRRWRCPA